MHDEDTQHTVSINPSKLERLPLRQDDEAQDERQEEEQHGGRADETLLLSHGAEDEVGVLFRHELQFCLRAVEETFAPKSSGTDGNLTLVHIVAQVAHILRHAQYHLDAVLLVFSHHVVEHDARGIEENDGAEGEHGDIEEIAHTGAQALIEIVAYERRAKDELHPDDVERYDIFRKEEEHHGHSQDDAGEPAGLLLVFAIYIHQSYGEEVDEQQHDKLSQGRWRVPQRDLLITDAHDEIKHHGHSREEDAPRHALPVEHEEESQIDKRRTCLALQDDARHGHENDGARQREVSQPVDVVAIRTHELADGQRRCKLGELCRLHPEAAQHEPRTGTLDGDGVEDGGKEQQDEKGVQHVSKRVVILVVEHQQHEAKADGRAYPHQLHARTCGEAQDVGLAERVAGTAYAHPPEDEESHVDGDGPIVERSQHAGLVTCLCFHISNVGFVFLQPVAGNLRRAHP